MNIPSVEIWLIVGIIFIIIELSAISGIGFLFVGLGALTTSVLIHLYKNFENYQIATFGLTSLCWFLMVWWSLKIFLYNKKNNESEWENFELIGSKVIVFEREMAPGQNGVVNWSGTTMNATLSSFDNEYAKVGDILYVIDIKGNILICSKEKKIHVH